MNLVVDDARQNQCAVNVERFGGLRAYLVGTLARADGVDPFAVKGNPSVEGETFVADFGVIYQYHIGDLVSGVCQ